MNGIKTRHYALNQSQEPTHDVYDLAAAAVRACAGSVHEKITYLSAGSTNTPLVAPGISSLMHSRLAEEGILEGGLEINSNTGVCTASAQALVNACRAIRTKDHSTALCIGVEQPSAILKSSVICVPDDRDAFDRKNLTQSRWFMSVFLRSMLSDGAGAFLISDSPSADGISYRVNWTYSQSHADRAPLCMKLESRSLLLSQDVSILAEHLGPCVRSTVENAIKKQGDSLSRYHLVLPHLSSFYFRQHMLGVISELNDGRPLDYWTNLEHAGNTGSASIFIMLDELTRNRPPSHGDNILLFIPESGQFNFVIVSLTAHLPRRSGGLP
jgi:3-oxoacyl-[acyl-carrier-protein] synthase-3